MNPEIELAWAAGFFDGEGTSYYSPEKSSLRVNIGQVNKPLLDRFAAAVGYGNVAGPYHQKNLKWRDYYMWQAYGKKAIAVMDSLWPYLSETKRDQWLRTMKKREEKRAA